MSAALIMSLIVILVIIFSGYRNGLFSSATTLFMLALAIAIAAEFYGPIAATSLLQNTGDYAEPLCMAVLFVVGYFMLQMTVNLMTPPALEMRRSVNKIGGIGLSVVNATILSGFMGMVFCMMPWTGVHGGELQGKSFIGTSIVADGVARLARGLGGNAADPDALFTRLKITEVDRECYRNLDDILDRVSDLYSYWEPGDSLTEATMKDAVQNGGSRLPADGASGGKGVGAGMMFCPGDDKPYVFVPTPIGGVATKVNERKVQVYDPEYSHVVDGKPARMVLSTWRGLDLAGGGRVKVQGKIELMTEEQFDQAQ